VGHTAELSHHNEPDTMDAFYYWKNHEQELKARRVGHFKSSSDKLQELADGQPEFIWVFKTPPGRKGELQLLGRLHWMPAPTRGFHREAGFFYIHYDPNHPQSEMFVDSDTDAAIKAVTHWVSRHFPSMRSANYQGASSQEALRGLPLKELKDLSRGFTGRPLLPAADGTSQAE
jgi:hypothetical protein